MYILYYIIVYILLLHGTNIKHLKWNRIWGYNVNYSLMMKIRICLSLSRISYMILFLMLINVAFLWFLPLPPVHALCIRESERETDRLTHSFVFGYAPTISAQSDIKAFVPQVWWFGLALCSHSSSLSKIRCNWNLSHVKYPHIFKSSLWIHLSFLTRFSR